MNEVEALLQADREVQRANIGKRLSQGWARRRARGACGSHPPYGFNKVLDRLVPDAAQQAKIEVVVQLWLAGTQQKEIARAVDLNVTLIRKLLLRDVRTAATLRKNVHMLTRPLSAIVRYTGSRLYGFDIVPNKAEQRIIRQAVKLRNGGMNVASVAKAVGLQESLVRRILDRQYTAVKKEHLCSHQ